MPKIRNLILLAVALLSLQCKRTEHRIVTIGNAACLEKPDINSHIVENFSENVILETQPTNVQFTMKGMFGQDIKDIWHKVPKAKCYAFGGELALFQYASESTRDLASLAGWWHHLNKVFDKNDSSKWCEEVTKEYCQKGNEYLLESFQGWRSQFQTFIQNELRGEPQNARLSFYDGKLSITGDNFNQGLGLAIKLENGRYRINEN